MSLIIDTTYRTEDTEIMDNFSLNGNMLHNTLNQLASINKWLGGNKVTIDGLKLLLKTHPKNKEVIIMDLGCGGADILREVSKFGKKKGYRFKLIGVDANADIIAYAKKLSQNYDDINFVHCDIFSETFRELKYDIVLGSLFLHHFKEDQIVRLLSVVQKKAKMGIVVNDLHRHALAYYLFKLICLTIKNPMTIEDGLTSILRGFKRQDLENISKQLNATYQIHWKWAFRYQWIITKSKFKN